MWPTITKSVAKSFCEIPVAESENNLVADFGISSLVTVVIM